MGYDMRYRKADPDEAAAVEKSYFRLNIFGMGRYRGLMDRLGMLFDAPDHPEWPEPEQYATSYDDVDALESPEYYPEHQWTESALRAAVAFKEARDAVLSWHGPEIPGIPAHKFGSNDGWIVLPAECEAAIRIWRQFVAGEGDEKVAAVVAEYLGDGDGRMDYWLKWIMYLADAVKHDGFEVH